MEKPLIQGAAVRKLSAIHDDRGWLMEMLRSDWPEFENFAQSYITVCYPGVAKAWHYHKQQTDHFATVAGMSKIVLFDDRAGSPTHGLINEFISGERSPLLIKIPTYVWHGFAAVGPERTMIVNYPTRLYNYKEPDEFRKGSDDPSIPYSWEVKSR
jgi:dTDP-4-dehydrorhamnose 3,5-epimerase